MASNLSVFLRKRNKVRKEKTITVDLRNGERAEVDIRELEPQEIKRLRSRNIKTYPPAERSAFSATQLDEISMAEDVVLTCLIAPDLSDASFQRELGVSSRVDALYELFNLDAIGYISGEVFSLTNENEKNKPTTEGVEPELINEAKNS